jgi:site-specific DNA-methyltransferase (adenine-specific)
VSGALTGGSAPRNVILVGDVRKRLVEVPTRSVDCVITSPPYFNLRNYGVRDQIGLEGQVSEWVDELRLVMGGIARVLKPSGSVWLNLGDTYSRHDRYGSPPKSVLLGPERLALGLIEDGWTIRNKVVWAKNSVMPNPVRDRLSCTWEVVYFLTRERRYFFDLDAIRIPHRSNRPKQRGVAVGEKLLDSRPDWAGPLAGNNAGLARMKATGIVGHPLGKNPGDVWQLPVSNYRGAHHATFPPALVERPLLATCPERVCIQCGGPWRRENVDPRRRKATKGDMRANCSCQAGWQPGLVLDPFCGANTTGLVAERLGRDWLGIELNPTYARLAEERIAKARRDHGDGEVRRAA